MAPEKWSCASGATVVAHGGPQAVGADECCAFDHGAVDIGDGNRLVTGLDASDVEAGRQGDRGEAVSARPQARMEVGAVEGEIGRAVSPFGMRAQGNGGEPPARDAVEQTDRFGREGGRRDRIQNAEFPKKPRGIRPELNAGAAFLGEARAFEDGAVEAGACQRDCRGKPANAAAGDEDGPCFAIRRDVRPQARRAGQSLRTRSPQARSPWP